MLSAGIRVRARGSKQVAKLSYETLGCHPAVVPVATHDCPEERRSEAEKTPRVEEASVAG